MRILHSYIKMRRNIRHENDSGEMGHALTLHPCISETANRYRSSSPDSDFLVVAVESRDESRVHFLCHEPKGLRRTAYQVMRVFDPSGWKGK